MIFSLGITHKISVMVNVHSMCYLHLSSRQFSRHFMEGIEGSFGYRILS